VDHRGDQNKCEKKTASSIGRFGAREREVVTVANYLAACLADSVPLREGERGKRNESRGQGLALRVNFYFTDERKEGGRPWRRGRRVRPRGPSIGKRLGWEKGVAGKKKTDANF